MSSIKVVEIGCDICGSGDHYWECSKASADKQYRDEGGFIRKGKHICTQECLDKYNKEA